MGRYKWVMVMLFGVAYEIMFERVGITFDRFGKEICDDTLKSRKRYEKQKIAYLEPACSEVYPEVSNK